MKKILALLALGLASSTATGTTTDTGSLALEQIMADPDWIGNAPQTAWWSDSAEQVYYWQKRQGESVRDLYRIDRNGGQAERIPPGTSPRDSARQRVYAPGRSAAAWIEQGDLYLKSLDSGQVLRITASAEDESQPLFSVDGQQLYFLRSGQYHAYDRASGQLSQLSDLRSGTDPDEEPAFDPLREHQLRTFGTLREQIRREATAGTVQRKRADRAIPVYLGEQRKVIRRALSPNGRYLALVTETLADDNARGTMPNYVTADGYVHSKEVRDRVGRQPSPRQQLLVADITQGTLREVALENLPGRKQDPLAALRKQALAWHVEQGASREPLAKVLEAPELRALSLEKLLWSPDGQQLAVRILARDFKDRWLVTLEPGDGDDIDIRVQDRLSDEAWINWKHNEFGWFSDSRRLWFLSEVSAYSHLYITAVDERRTRQVTRGEFVVKSPIIGPDEKYAWVVANPDHPGNHQVYRVALDGGELQAVSGLDGVSSFRLSPDGKQLLVSRSWIDRHPDLYVGPSDGSEAMRQLTDTVSAAYKAISWTIPEIVQVPSSHQSRPIYGKLYLPEDHNPQQRYPAVLFVHGAGYTQNAHMGWPYYFREFMFHTLLNQAGYVVLDLDYRGSEGYGRDWRTTIYRQMGHPELEDYLDGIDYLVDTQGVDRSRVGIYGGSYGGFMTFMALFRAPEAFAAGAALRPVADWMHYENDYTRRILNTPLIDPVAYQRSSPINHAEGLSAPLLIASGMQDDNVFFQDSVLMVQRLLELKKPDFEIAIYPLDGHGFTHPESWLDEYRRIFKLMQENLQ